LIVSRPFLIPRGDAVKLLVAVNQPLNLVPSAVTGPVEGAGAMFIRFPWDGAPEAMSPHVLPNLAAVVGLVAHKALRPVFRPTGAWAFHGALGHELGKEARFMLLARRQQQWQELTDAVATEVVGMTRQRSLRVVQRDESLFPCIQTLKAAHPFWGYRRIWADLRFVEQRALNKKRILRLMREHQLLVTPNLRLRAKWTPTGSKPKPTRPNEWWGIDMTEVLVEQPWLIKHPRSSNEIMTTATGLHSLPLDSRGALHAASSAMRNAVRQ
jgi:hypothetical protein